MLFGPLCIYRYIPGACGSSNARIARPPTRMSCEGLGLERQLYWNRWGPHYYWTDLSWACRTRIVRLLAPGTFILARSLEMPILCIYKSIRFGLTIGLGAAA